MSQPKRIQLSRKTCGFCRMSASKIRLAAPATHEALFTRTPEKWIPICPNHLRDFVDRRQDKIECRELPAGQPKAPTPRTDSEIKLVCYDSGEVAKFEGRYIVYADFASALEDDLITATEVAEKQTATIITLQRTVAEQAERIKVLEADADNWEKMSGEVILERDQLRSRIKELEAERNEAYGKGVSAGKQEALNYSADERQNYGRWVTEQEVWLELKTECDSLRARLNEIESAKKEVK